MNSNTKNKGKKAKIDTKLSEEQRQHCVEVAAYYIAASKGFVSGHDLENWLDAEAEVDRMLAEDKL